MLVTFCMVCLPVWQNSASDVESLHVILDAEIESAIHTYLDPMLEAAGIPPSRIRVVLINTPVMNASAISGGLMAINTGLLLKVKNLDQLLGVLAHEVGHFMGGHHARIEQAMAKSQRSFLVGALLGGLALAVGHPEAALAAMLGSQNVAVRSYLYHRRGEETAADQSAVNILDKLQLSSKGLASFFEFLASAEISGFSKQDSYLITHPLHNERIRFVQIHAAQSPYRDAQPPQAWQEIWARAQSKLRGFMEEPEKTIKMIGTPKTIADQYALAVAYYKKYDLKSSLLLAQNLIAQEPNNPFFNEFLGQVLFESGQVAAAIPFYKKATHLNPRSLLLSIGAAHALIEEGSKASVTEAVGLLEKAILREKDNIMAWHFLAVAYGKQEQMGRAAAALAEKSLLSGDTKTARSQAQRAVATLPKGSPQWHRAKDIVDTTPEHGH